MARPKARKTKVTTPQIQQAHIGRFDGELKLVGFNAGDTIAILLTKAGVSLGTGDALSDDTGSNVSREDIAKNGMTYYITSNYKQGSY